MNSDESTFFQIDLTKTLLLTEFTIGGSELLLKNNDCGDPEHNHSNHVQAIYLKLKGPDGQEVEAIVPVDTDLGHAILSGDLELMAKKCLDNVT